MKFNLKNSVIDYIVIGSLIIASGIFTALFYLNDEEGASVSVYYHSEKITTLNLKKIVLLLWNQKIIQIF